MACPLWTGLSLTPASCAAILSEAVGRSALLTGCIASPGWRSLEFDVDPLSLTEVVLVGFSVISFVRLPLAEPTAFNVLPELPPRGEPDAIVLPPP